MTIEMTQSVAEFLGTGQQLVLPVPFPFRSADDIAVFRMEPGGAVPLIRGVHFQVQGKSVRSLAAVAAGSVWRVERHTSRLQTTDYVNGGSFAAETHEAALDRLAMVDQEQDAAIARTVRLPDGNGQLPPATLRANRLLGFDAAGAPSPVTLDAAFRGPPGAPLDVGLFAELWTQDIPAPAKMIITAGHSRVGEGIAHYARDPGVTPAVAAANPVITAISGNGIGFHIAETEVTAAMFGARSDGIDSTAQLQQWAQSTAGSRRLGKRGDIFVHSQPLTSLAHADIDFGGAKLIYTGPRNTAAFEFGARGGANFGMYRNVWIETIGDLTLTDPEFVLARFINVQRSSIDIHRIVGATRGVELLASGAGFTGTRVNATFIGDSRYAITTTSDGDAPQQGEPGYNGDTYFNGNIVDVIDWTNVRLFGGDSFGWHARGTGARPSGQNGNRIGFQSIQPGNGNPGDIRCLAFLQDIAALNIISCGRFESGRGPVAVVSGALGDGVFLGPNDIVVRNNTFILGPPPARHEGLDIVEVIDERGSAHGNHITFVNVPARSTATLTLDTLVSLVRAWSPTEIVLASPLHITGNDGEPADRMNPGAIKITDGCIDFGAASRSIGFFVDVAGGETFSIRSLTKGQPGLLGITPYGADGTRLTPPPGERPDVVAGENTQFNWWRPTDYGGCYLIGSPTNEWSVTLSTRVKRARVFFCGNALYRGFGLARLSAASTPLVAESGLPVTVPTVLA